MELPEDVPRYQEAVAIRLHRLLEENGIGTVPTEESRLSSASEALAITGDPELPEGWDWWEGAPPEEDDEKRRVLCATSKEGYTIEVYEDGEEDYLAVDGGSFEAVEAVIARRRTGADDGRRALRGDRVGSEEQEVPMEISFEEALDYLLLECQAVEELEWDSEELTQYCGQPFGKREFIDGSMTRLSFEVVEEYCRSLQAKMGESGERLTINWRVVEPDGEKT